MQGQEGAEKQEQHEKQEKQEKHEGEQSVKGKQIEEGIKMPVEEAENEKENKKMKSPENVMELEWELREMGFEENLIQEALLMTTDKDKAISHIIAILEEEDSKKMKPKMMEEGEKENEEDFQDIEQDYKMLFIVRMDLKMGLGKIAAQVGHATLKAYKQMQIKAENNQLDEVAFYQWMESGQKKIVVKAPTEQELLKVLETAKNLKMNTCYIRDAGLTQIQAGSLTVGAIGPAASSELDPITKHLKLL